jgi:hypothetical protein
VIADLAVLGPPRDLLAGPRDLDRHDDRAGDGGDDQQLDDGMDDGPDHRSDEQERDEHTDRDGGEFQPTHPPAPSQRCLI